MTFFICHVAPPHNATPPIGSFGLFWVGPWPQWRGGGWYVYVRSLVLLPSPGQVGLILTARISVPHFAEAPPAPCASAEEGAQGCRMSQKGCSRKGRGEPPFRESLPLMPSWSPRSWPMGPDKPLLPGPTSSGGGGGAGHALPWQTGLSPFVLAELSTANVPGGQYLLLYKCPPSLCVDRFLFFTPVAVKQESYTRFRCKCIAHLTTEMYHNQNNRSWS